MSSEHRLIELLSQLNSRLDSLKQYESTMADIIARGNKRATIEYTKQNGTQQVMVVVTGVDGEESKELLNHVLEKDKEVTFE